MWPRVVGETQRHAAARAPSTRLSHSAIWFQLVKIRVTIFPSILSRSLNCASMWQFILA